MSIPQPRHEPNGLLGRLVGYRLLSVVFLQHYVQFRFLGEGPDMPLLTCEEMPSVEVGGIRYLDGDRCYADALRALISGMVLSTREETGLGLVVRCDGGTLTIHPTAGEPTGPEIAVLSDFEDGSWMCWRPGEDSFEDLA